MDLGRPFLGGGVIKCVTEYDRWGGEGVKKIGKSADVVYGRPLKSENDCHFKYSVFNSVFFV